ncbi:MAG: DUF4369 domain-containing protein [Bacteroidaceae bacterium]|nr:DUF4369 domain-containing protein [Bacteroidaceae bacterium]
MNKVISFALIFLLLSSCGERKERYNIAGRIENSDGIDSVTLACSPNGISLDKISTSAVVNGQFAFNGYIENAGIAYICYDSHEHDVCSMFFLEKGDTEIFIDSTRLLAKGTPLNNLNNIIDDSIKYYIAKLGIIEEQYYSYSLSDDEFARLGAEGFNLQERLVEYLRMTIQENAGNLLGLYMLVVYNDFFTPEELDRLIAQIPPSSIDRKNNPLYDIIVGIAQERKAWK